GRASPTVELLDQCRRIHRLPYTEVGVELDPRMLRAQRSWPNSDLERPIITDVDDALAAPEIPGELTGRRCRSGSDSHGRKAQRQGAPPAPCLLELGAEAPPHRAPQSPHTDRRRGAAVDLSPIHG